MTVLMPKTASPRDIQRNYRSLFDEVKATEEPLLVLSNNQPDVVVISYEQYEAFKRSQEEYEESRARIAVENYAGEKKAGRLRKLSSLAELG